MQRRQWSLFALVLLVAEGRTATAQQESPADTTIHRILEEKAISRRNAGIVVGVLDQRGRRVVAYGPEGGPALDGNTVFEIGSMTKVFTTSVLATMVVGGEVNLDDPIAKFLPATVKVPTKDGKQITLLDLATHTSGLPRLPTNLAPADAGNPYADYTVERLYDFLSSYELPRGIGETYEYSNLGVGLLGHVLGLEAGTTYAVLVSARILEPLHMHDTKIVLSPELQKRLATGHDAAGNAVENWDLPTLAGAGSLRSTVNDLLEFLAANLDTSAVGLPAVLRRTHAVRSRTGSPDLDIGLGWHVRRKFDRDLVWHNGATGGYSSFIGFDPTRHMGVVVLSNSASSVDDLGFHLLDTRFPLSKPEPTRQHTEVRVDLELLDAYAGKYELAPGFVIAITRQADGLFLQATGQAKVPVFPESETTFFLKVVEAQVTFVKNGSGQVTQLILHQAGRDSAARKIE